MFILNIDTSVNKGSFCITKENEVLAYEHNDSQNKLAGWLHQSISEAFDAINLKLENINAVSVSNGPGSYTGLRIGLATAKGICYALKKPLICINTLQIMANAVKAEATDIICPMIDARRMEVFTALFNKNMDIYRESFSEVLTSESFKDILENKKILFTGNGSDKFKELIKNNNNAEFLSRDFTAKDMALLSQAFFINKNFSDLAYSEPYYIKDVYISSKASF